MSDDGKNPKKEKVEFRKQNDNEKVVFRKEDEQDKGERPKANASPAPKPHNARSLEPSPSGTVFKPASRNVNISVVSEEVPAQQIDVNLDRSDVTLEYERNGLNVLLTIEDFHSKQGIDGGRISRLTVTEGEFGHENILTHFENGEWIEEPDTFLEKQIVMEAKENHNGIETPDIERKTTQSRDQSRDL